MSAYDQAGADDSGEPLADDPMTADEMHQIAEDKLQALGESLATRRDAWISARRASKVEKRWLDDIDQYNGRDEATKEAASMMDSVEAGFPVTNKQAKPQRSTVFVNITRPKTNSAEARLANMLLPSDDRNWGLKPTPDPKLTQAAIAQAKAQAQAAIQQAQQGQPPGAPPVAPVATMAPQGPQPMMPGAAAQPPMPAASPMAMAVQSAYPSPDAQAVLDEAERCAKAMQDELDDCLIACDFNGQERMMLHDCAVIGTGILKGPIVVNRMRKAWKKIEGSSVFQLEIDEEKSPASERVDPWDCFPDPSCGEDIHNGIGIFERRNISARQVRELSKQPGYLKDQLSKILEEGPAANSEPNQREIKEQSEGQLPENKDHFQLWEYWGEFTPEDLRAAGVNVPDGATESISGCVIFVNQTVIKGFLNPIETGDLPYDFMVWEKVDGSCWGYGVPHLMRPAQRVLNAAWRQLMDNSGLSIGPQVVIDTQAIAPMDERWELSGRKLWAKIDASVDVQKAFGIFEISSHSEEIQKIIELALKFADEESSVPMLAQGEKGTAPDTVGGMTLLMNSSNVVLGRMVKQFDDMVTRPHIRRYYDWYMAYGEKDECKGDFQVDARGTSALLVRDIANQALLQAGQFAANGVIAPMINWESWFKEFLKTQHIDPTDIMKSDAEIAAQQAQPPQATPEQIRAQALLAVAEKNADSREKVANAKVQGELAYADREASIAEADAAAQRQISQDKREMLILEYSLKNNLTLEQVKADLAKTAMQEQTKRSLAEADVQMQTAEQAKDRTHDLNGKLLDHAANAHQNAADRTHEANMQAMQPAPLEPRP